jgi:hypothetical protein
MMRERLVIVVDMRWRTCRGPRRFIHLMSTVWTSIWTSIWAIDSVSNAIGLASSHNPCERASRMCRTASREKRSQHVGTEYSIFQRSQPEGSSIDPSMAFWNSDVSVDLVRSLALDMDRRLPALSPAHGKVCRYGRMYTVVSATFRDTHRIWRALLGISRDQAAVSATLMRPEHAGTSESFGLAYFGIDGD